MSAITPSDTFDGKDLDARVDGAGLRAHLIAIGVLVERPVPRAGDPSPEPDRPGPRLRLDRPGPRLRLDDAGRREAARELAAWRTWT